MLNSQTIMDGKSTSTPWRAADIDTRPAAPAEGRREASAGQIDLLHGVRGALTRWGLALLTRSGQLWRVNGTIRGRWFGQPVAIPLVFGHGIQHVRTSERWMYDVVRKLLQRTPHAFVDVGANIGQTLLKVKMADQRRDYYGFEPNPVAVAYLQQLIARNRFTRATVFPIGLSDHTAVVTLFLKDDVDPSASIVTGFRQPERYATAQGVSVHRGDEVLGQIEGLRVGIMKIDVEGAELDVITGCQRAIARDKPFIVCEVLPVYDPASATGRLRLSRQQALRALLTRLGYDVYRANDRGRFEPIDDFTIDSDLAHANYLFMPAGTPAGDL